MRARCVVPFCARSKGKLGGHSVAGHYVQYTEYICPEHWRLVPRQLRLLYRRSKTRLAQDGCEKNARRYLRVWDWCIRNAIERASGL